MHRFVEETVVRSISSSRVACSGGWIERRCDAKWRGAVAWLLFVCPTESVWDFCLGAGVSKDATIYRFRFAPSFSGLIAGLYFGGCCNGERVKLLLLSVEF